MEKETLKNIFNFLEKNDNIKTPLMGKFMSEMPLTKEELNFKGNLNLEFTKITSLPEGLKVGGWMSLGYSKIESLPEGLKVGGNLHLEHCTNLTSLPKGLEVGWELSIKGSKLEKYTDDELREMIEPGFIEYRIVR